MRRYAKTRRSIAKEPASDRIHPKKPKKKAVVKKKATKKKRKY